MVGDPPAETDPTAETDPYLSGTVTGPGSGR
jgi:hypothetical protein